MKQILKQIITTIIQWEARLVLLKYKPKIIAITGSVGKTSTKDAIYTVLNRALYVRRSQKSFNSEIGIPLTILDCQNAWTNPLLWLKNIFVGLSLILFKNHYPKWLVLEVGADRPGDIEKVTKWLKPDIAVITRFGQVPVHVEQFDSIEHVIREKTFLAQAVKPNGLLLLNADDAQVLKLKDAATVRTLTYGFKDGASMQATNAAIAYDQDLPCGVSFKLEHNGRTMPVRLEKLLGRHHIYAALAALCIADELGINLVDALEYVNDYESPPGRLHLLSGLKGSMVIDDSYNSSPVALNAALDTLEEIRAKGKKVAILGDMLELGHYTKDEHQKSGRKAGRICELLLLTGDKAHYYEQGAHAAGMDAKMVKTFKNSQEAGKFAEMQLEDGDVVLVKGSQSMRMERAVEEIMAQPEQAHMLLVRQEQEWKER